MKRFLIKSWIYPFYKTYAGFLFVVFLIAIGILRVDEHIALGYFFTSHINNFLYPLILFILYELLTIHFSVKWISDSKNRIIRELLFLKDNHRIRSLVFIILCLQIPVILYTLFLLGMSIIAGKFLVFSILIILTVVRIFLYAVILNRILIFPIERSFRNPFRLSLPSKINYPIINFSLKHMLTQRFLSFILSKILSIAVLFAGIYLIPTIDNYSRFSAFVIFLIFLSNAFLSYDLFNFHHVDLNLFRSLPIQLRLFLLQTFILLIILTLPEIIIIYRNFSQIADAGFITLHVLNGLVTLILLYAYLLFQNIDLKAYIIRIFWGSLIVVMLLLFDVPVYILIIILVTATFYFYFNGFYSFEMIYDQTEYE